MRSFSNRHRAEFRAELQSKTFDLVVIGGGITGGGIALDAASRGMTVALIEKGDFASGTSSKSTKLIHGGLRYLKQFDFWLVKEIGKERGILHRLAPHLVVPEKMLLPILKDGNFGAWMTSFGLKVYDLLASVEGDDKRVMLDAEETIEREPLLPGSRVEGGGLYAEYRTDDARLTIEVIKTAYRHGALAFNYCEVLDFLKEDERVKGVLAKDLISGANFEVNARTVINATGPWVDLLRSKSEQPNGMLSRLQPTKGVHLVFPHEKLPLQQAIYFDVPDGRMIFGIPRDKTTYVGTTDTIYSEAPEKVKTEMVDALYLIEAVNLMFPSVHLELEDVISSWAGLRPLLLERGKSATELSRKDEIIDSESGLLSIAGGKLTGYRKMAERIVDKVAERLAQNFDRKTEEVQTHKIPLNPEAFTDRAGIKKAEKLVGEHLSRHGLDPSKSIGLVHLYGPQVRSILDRFDLEKGKDAEVRLGKAELNYCLENEMIATALDFFERRTGKLYFEPGTIENLLQPVIAVMAIYFGWDDSRIAQEQNAVNEALNKARNFS